MGTLTDLDLSVLWISVQLATVTVIVLLIVGTPLAWWLAHTRSRFRPIVDAAWSLRASHWDAFLTVISPIAMKG